MFFYEGFDSNLKDQGLVYRWDKIKFRGCSEYNIRTKAKICKKHMFRERDRVRIRVTFFVRVRASLRNKI
jgi:hypothetical protein